MTSHPEVPLPMQTLGPHRGPHLRTSAHCECPSSTAPSSLHTPPMSALEVPSLPSYGSTKPRLIQLQNTPCAQQDGDSMPRHHSPTHNTLAQHAAPMQPSHSPCSTQNPKENPRLLHCASGDTIDRCPPPLHRAAILAAHYAHANPPLTAVSFLSDLHSLSLISIL